MTTTAAIYARFSTDRQDRTSIDDQQRACRAWSDARGMVVVATYADQAVSGSIPVTDRPGGAAMHADALAGRYDVLVIEGLDRLSRDQVDTEQVVRRLEHRGVRIVGVADGYDSASGPSRHMLRGVRGIVNEAYRRELGPKVRRGLAGQVERGYHAGGMAYGYRSVPTAVTERGEARDYRLEIVPEQAAIVREVYARFGRGESLQRIASDLNARGVPGPGRKRGRPSTWSVAALYGTPAAGSGIINNALYTGCYTWNRREWVHDPDNPRRRTARLRPRSEWRIDARPELRIVDDEAWDRVRKRMGEPRERGGRAGRGAPPRTLFGGLLRCGTCGGAVIAVSRTAYGCAAHKDRGASVCGGVRAPRGATDRRLLATIRDAVLAPAALAEIVGEVRRVAGEARRRAGEASRAHQARRAEVEAEVVRLADAVAQVGLSAALRERLAQAEAALAALEREARVPQALPSDAEIAREVREVAMQLQQALAGSVAEAREALADRLGPIVLRERDGGVWAETQIGPAMLVAGGADSRSGCGGPVRELESARPGPTVWLGDAPKRRRAA